MTVNDETTSSESDCRERAARIQFVKSWIQPVLEDVEKEIKKLELILAIMNTKMTLLVGHQKVFQELKEIVMNRGVDFQDQESHLGDEKKLKKVEAKGEGMYLAYRHLMYVYMNTWPSSVVLN
uniref:Uncharacterized protein LOC104238640 n=1 Tax=Nicotiana sylvestris TaxID=4096 RepID=A0A1U7XWP9_NICSY|nr:PREDICTED: uncharacterized protein LOC104238640 [Nicotiana sylvestris]